jgi:hypothetical protein
MNKAPAMVGHALTCPPAEVIARAARVEFRPVRSLYAHQAWADAAILIAAAKHDAASQDETLRKTNALSWRYP